MLILYNICTRFNPIILSIRLNHVDFSRCFIFITCYYRVFGFCQFSDFSGEVGSKKQNLALPRLSAACRHRWGVGDGPVRSTVPYGPWDSPVWSTGPHGTNLHSPVLGEGRTGQPLDRTKVRYEFGHSPVWSTIMGRSGTGWTGRSISKLKMDIISELGYNLSIY
jgi:hypothetical protein